MKKSFLLGFILPAALLFAACNYFPADVEEQLVSITSYDTNANFRQYQTFAITDSIGILNVDNQGTLYIKYQSTELDKQVIAAVSDQLTNYCGYTQVQKGSATAPDLIVDLYYSKVVNVSVYYPDWWWYWYDYGWFPPYYPYYPEVVTSYSVGTLYMDMKDMSTAKNKIDKTTPVQVKGIWVGAVRGLYTGTHSSAEVKSAINDCFTQTPGLKK